MLHRFVMNVKNLGGSQSIWLAVLLITTTVVAWTSVIRSASVMHMPQMEPLTVAAGLVFTLEWGVMMTAMMLPSAAPMILLYDRSHRRSSEGRRRGIPAEVFGLTYVVLWLLTGVPVYLAWVWLGNLAQQSPTFAAAIPYAISGTIFAAGIYQLSPAKHACLRQCESPVDFLMRRWRSGYAATLHLAVAHSLYCIGCCWALMLILVVAGTMSLPWVLGIALLVFAEKVLPGGERTARITGIVLIVAGLTMTLIPDVAGTLSPTGMH